MSKSRSHNIINTVYEIATEASAREIVHLYTQNESLNGREINIGGHDLINFGSCSYLGLETDQRLKDGAIEAVQNFGTQFSSSRSYVSVTLYSQLESLLSEIFNAHVVITPTTTLGHLAAIPVLLDDNDAVILDQQVHMSVQTGVQIARQKGIHVEMIRHNNMEKLYERIKILKQKYNKIWYMADGVYSMYGDFAPADTLYEYLEEFEQFNIYFDDAHGMSCFGKNGSGYVLSRKAQHPRIVISASFAKAFGTGGGILVFKNPYDRDRVQKCGAPMIYSGPIQPPTLGASIASAKIHLSSEITILQKKLNEKIRYTRQLLTDNELPVIANNDSPIFFVGAGLPKVGYNIISKLKERGFFVNIGIFPAVPIKCTGIRFSINNHLELNDINRMIGELKDCHALALNEEGSSLDELYKVFKLKPDISVPELPPVIKLAEKEITIQHFNSIDEIDSNLWDKVMGGKSTYDHAGIKLLEKVFKNNPEIENNWNFHYFIVKDKNNKIILASWLTECIMKDDMLVNEKLSQNIENKRTSDKYYLTSKILSSGCFVSEGEHIYMDYSHKNIKIAVSLFLEFCTNIKEKNKLDGIMLRDFESGSIPEELLDFIHNEGFVVTDLPDNSIAELEHWEEEDEFMMQISKKSRRHLRKYVIPYENLYKIKIYNKDEKPTNEQISHWYQMYLNVKNNNFIINTFDIPEKFFYALAGHDQWEIIELKINDSENKIEDFTAGVVFCYKQPGVYGAFVMGLDYRYRDDYENYKQSLYQILKRSNDLKMGKLMLGYSASYEKKFFGAKSKPMIALIQLSDHFNLDVIHSMSAG